MSWFWKRVKVTKYDRNVEGSIEIIIMQSRFKWKDIAPTASKQLLTLRLLYK